MNKAIFLLVLFFGICACSTHRKTTSRDVIVRVDTASKSTKSFTGLKADSLESIIQKRIWEKSVTENITYERGGQEEATAPFQITAAFTIDTTVNGDTLRLVSQENDQVKFQVYFDKKSGQAVAQIQGKGRTVKTPFEKISITNATVTKDTDSAGALKKGSVATFSAASTDSSASSKAQTIHDEKSELTRKQTGITNIVWGIVAIAAAAAILLFIFRKSIF